VWDLGPILFLALGVLAALAGLLSLREGQRFRRYVRESLRWAPAPLPPVAVLSPIRGAHAALAGNLDALLSQEYPQYRVIFAVDAFDDPAVAVIRAAVDRHSVPALVVLSPGPRDGGSGKASALARASEELGPGDRVVVTWDADATPHRRWLAALVGALEDGVGAATGYRWYAAGDFWTSVRSAWNATGYNVLFQDRHNFAWGGATAIPRDVFDAAGLATTWPRWLSDDLAVTLAVKARGLRVRFVPRAVCATDEPCDRGRCVAWTTQQAAFVHLYNPRLTRYAAAAYAVFDGAVVLGVLGLVLAAILGWEHAVGAGLLLLDIPITILKAEQRRRALVAALPEWREMFAARAGGFLLASLAVPWLMAVNLWRARRLTTIEWSGRTYGVPGRGNPPADRKTP
jgi:cellulose synthase/poly-beta-1,6-N-acetylglucosamine synthase-like glycosyltransferase